MRLFPKKSQMVFFLISFILYGCVASSATSLNQPTASSELPVVTIPVTAPAPNKQKAGILLVENVDQQRYYVSNFDGSDMSPVDLPTDRNGMAMSPDGRMVAYIPREENQALDILDISSKKKVVLTGSDGITAGIGLAWSPDSQKIVFSCRIPEATGFGLCMADITGADLIKILVKPEILNASDDFDGVVSPAWSADGAKIMFLFSRSPSSAGEGVKQHPARSIWLFDVSTQTTRRIFADNTAGISFIFPPVLLPGENSVLFSGRKDTYNTIFKYDIDSQQLQDITSTGNRFDLLDIILSPDGKTFLSHAPLSTNPDQGYVPTLFSVDGNLLEQPGSLANIHVISWAAARP